MSTLDIQFENDDMNLFIHWLFRKAGDDSLNQLFLIAEGCRVVLEENVGGDLVVKRVHE